MVEINGYLLSPLEEQLYNLLQTKKRITFTELQTIEPRFLGSMGKLIQHKVARTEREKLPNPGIQAKSAPKRKREKYLVFIGEGD